MLPENGLSGGRDDVAVDADPAPLPAPFPSAKGYTGPPPCRGYGSTGARSEASSASGTCRRKPARYAVVIGAGTERDSRLVVMRGTMGRTERALAPFIPRAAPVPVPPAPVLRGCGAKRGEVYGWFWAKRCDAAGYRTWSEGTDGIAEGM